MTCSTEQVQFYLTPTVASPGEFGVPPTPIPAATELSGTQQSLPDLDDLASTVEPSRIEAVEVPLVIPQHHYRTVDAALAAAGDFGCTGWTGVSIDGIPFYRVCADGELYEQLLADEASDPMATVQPPLVAPIAPTPTASPQPTVVSSSQESISLPPYHYLSESEANTGARELGCSGWTRREVAGVSYFRSCGDDGEFELLSNGGLRTLSGDACRLQSDPLVRFNALPTDLSKIASIIPPGSPAGGVIKPHSYLHNKNNPDDTNVRVPVFAVADSVLTSVAYYATTVDTSEYLLFFDVSCEISFKFDHISEVAPKIAAVAPATAANTSQTTRTEAIRFEAGELIGYTVGAGGFGAWDFGAYDLTFTNQFANQERYEKGHMNQSIHTVCPYEYFEEPLKGQMYELFGTHDQRLLPGIECSTTERDVVGSASGAWFDSLNLEFSESKISLGLLPGDLVTITGIGSDVRIAKDNQTWRDPSLLTGSHCYFDNGRWFYLEIFDDGMQMTLAHGSGSCPQAMPAGATTYYR